MLLSIVSDQESTLGGHYADSLAEIPDGRRKDGGIKVGRTAATTMIGIRADDGRFGTYRFPVGTEPGQWRPELPRFVNDTNAWVAEVEPFLIESVSQFRTDGPHALDSRKYAREFNEVKKIGSLTSTTRTADQSDVARFWSEGPAIWTRVARNLSHRYDLRIADNARLFAMQYLTGADSLIACWDDKKSWLFWRPITAIREAENDRNPATEADTGWLPFIDTSLSGPLSGLSAVSSAMGETLEDFFGTDRVRFGALGVNSGTTRRFTRFSQAVQEVVNARVWSGIHFRLADEDGARIGKRVARYRDRQYFEENDD